MTITINKQSFAILGRGYNNENYDSGLSPETTITGITLTVPLTPFDKGDILSGLVVTATTSDSTTIDVTNYAHIDPFTNGDELTISGTITITAELYGFSDSGNITVTEPAVSDATGTSNAPGELLSPDGDYIYHRTNGNRTLEIINVETEEVVFTHTFTDEYFNNAPKRSGNYVGIKATNTTFLFDKSYNLLMTLVNAAETFATDERWCVDPAGEWIYVFHTDNTRYPDSAGIYRINIRDVYEENCSMSVSMSGSISGQAWYRNRPEFITDTKVVFHLHYDYGNTNYTTQRLCGLTWDEASKTFTANEDYNASVDLSYSGGYLPPTHYGDNFRNFTANASGYGVFAVSWGSSSASEDRDYKAVNAFHYSGRNIYQTAAGVTGDRSPKEVGTPGYDFCARFCQTVDKDSAVMVVCYDHNGVAEYDLILVHISDHAVIYRRDITAEWNNDMLISGVRLYSPSTGYWRKFIFV